MNFFKRKDAFRLSSAAVEPARSAGPLGAPPPEPTELDEWSEALAESGPEPLVKGEDAPDAAPDHGLSGYEPGDERDLLPEHDPEEADEKTRYSPFEARLASLRQHLQEGPKIVADPPVQVEAEPEPVNEPDLPEPSPAPAPEPVSDSRGEEAKAALPHEPASETTRDAEVPSSFEDPKAELPVIDSAPEPSVGSGLRRAGRVKTRLLGFERAGSGSIDPLGSAAKEESPVCFPVGWIVVVKGPGRGASFCLYNGLSQIGRGSDQTVCLDFGDTSISRENHAVVAYDSEQKKHYLGHGGKANIVRLNDMPVLSTEELAHGDQIRIGETTLRFVALCGADFDWSMTATDDDLDAAFV